MSEDENFLARWSRKKAEEKREAERAPVARSHEQSPAVRPRTSGDPGPHGKGDDEAAVDSRLRGNERVTGPDTASKSEPPAPFDPATLPPIESIDAGTDIRDFLRPGVPAELRHAALRRVWSSDPNIRDFIGIAENQWDFTAQDGVPGFGPLKAIDDVRHMVAELTQPFDKRNEPATEQAQPVSSAADSDPRTARAEEAGLPASAPSERMPLALTENAAPQVSAPVNAALQQQPTERDEPPLPVRRSHGRALPD